jgi:exopolysaccharide biosynthesis polyprenyl glycosylphosphotransferase
VEAPGKSWRRVVQSGFTLAAVVSSACLALRYRSLIDYVLVGLPLATALTVVARQMVTLWLRSHRTGQRLGIVVGHATPVARLIAALRRTGPQDMRVVAACLADADRTTEDQLAALAVPVYGDLSDVRGTVLAAGCDFVIALPSPELDTPQLRQLAWSLHDVGVELMVAPALSDVATERVAVQPAGGSLLLHVRAPMLTGPQRVLKGVLDRVTASALLFLLSPVMIGTALLVRLTSPGPALFRQRRVGRNSREFTCLKFRTMTADAEARRAELAHLNERNDGLLFKMRNDPRITRVGGALRKYSIDELPQLINVVAGQMSLVGPRPPLPQEVAAYDDALRRRLLVKPGMTGLWQVSGRSELSWDESVRLDLSYVDNWSPALDARILLRTVAAVVRGTGAY